MQFVISWRMPDVHKDTRPVGLIAWHLAVGTPLIAVMAKRVIWRLTHWPTPDELSPLLRVVSNIRHFLLYAGLVLVPLSAGSTPLHAAGRSTCWMSYSTGIEQARAALGHKIGDVHGFLAGVFFASIGLHVGAALFYRSILKRPRVVLDATQRTAVARSGFRLLRYKDQHENQRTSSHYRD